MGKRCTKGAAETECERSSWKWRREVERGENVFVEVNPVRCAFPILPFISFLPALLHPFTHAALTPTDGNSRGLSPVSLSAPPAAHLV